MPSQRTLVWVGAGALAVVAAGAGAVVWTHPDFLEPNPADLAVARAPVESKPPIVPPAAPAVPAAPPASAPAPVDKAQTQTALVGPAFDIVNVDPSGEAVIAGRAAPNEKVELRDAGKTVAEATADGSGQFVIIPPALAPGDHSLSLAANTDKGQPATSSPVAVSVPAAEAKTAVAAGSPEAKPTVAAALPANPTAPPSPLGMRTLATPAAVSGARVSIQSVEADAPDGLVAKGSAEAQHHSPSLSQSGGYRRGQDAVRRPMVFDDQERDQSGRLCHPGRRDQSGRGDRRGERQHAIRVPGAGRRRAFVGHPHRGFRDCAEPSPAPSLADPVVASVQTKRVATGHTLWALSQSYYGDPTRYPAIVEANRAQIHNPNLIYPGEVFVVPKSNAKP